MIRAGSEEKRVYRTPRWHWVVLAAAFAVVAAMTVIAFTVDLSRWYKVGYAAFCALFVVGAVELKLRHLTIEADRITWTGNFRRGEVHRSEIESVTWAKGGGVSLKLTSGKWVPLPDVEGYQGLTNTIRAWLRRPATSR